MGDLKKEEAKDNPAINNEEETKAESPGKVEDQDLIKREEDSGDTPESNVESNEVTVKEEPVDEGGDSVIVKTEPIDYDNLTIKKELYADGIYKAAPVVIDSESDEFEPESDESAPSDDDVETHLGLMRRNTYKEKTRKKKKEGHT